jgi:two-component system sensor histidine kinase TctE
LLAGIVPALVVIAVFSGSFAYWLARYFSQSVLDQWLYDTAATLARRVQRSAHGIVVDVPQGAREMLEWDEIDRIYFEVLSGVGTRHFGDVPLPAPPKQLSWKQRSAFYDARIGTTPVRVLAIVLDDRTDPVVVVKVAETRLKRRVLASHVLWISVAVSVLLVVASAIIVWYAINRGTASIRAAVSRAHRASERTPLLPITIDQTMPEEVRPLIQDINELMENLHGAHRLNREFIANAAHQLRTPIASLRVQIEIALRETDPAKQQTALADAVKLLGRLGRMLHQLLIVARTDDASNDVGHATSVNIDQLAREELEGRLDDCAQLGIDLGYEGQGQPVTIAGSDTMYREAIANLIDNAVRYASSGGRITVGVTAGPPTVYVEDEGPGISATHLEHIGTRFYRVPGSPGEGCGLGIAIVKSILQRHGGHFTLGPGSRQRGLRATMHFPG